MRLPPSRCRRRRRRDVSDARTLGTRILCRAIIILSDGAGSRARRRTAAGKRCCARVLCIVIYRSAFFFFFDDEKQKIKNYRKLIRSRRWQTKKKN